MDQELLMALFFLWSSTTTALVIFMTMWLMNESEALHPHVVDIEQRHNLFLVVSNGTKCKKDFAVKSISAFVSPRGASSSKWFTALIIIMCISGMFGSFRWFKVGDADLEEAVLCIMGFGVLIFLSAFEADTSSARFLEEKLIVTSWLIRTLGGDKVLPFSLSPGNKEFRYFLRQSPEIYSLYKEDHKFRDQKVVPSLHGDGPYTPLWGSLHIIGAVCYLFFVSSAVILHEMEEETIANGVISWLSFFVFCLAGYLTGTYLPVIKSLQCIILVWNPFYYQPGYLTLLKKAIDNYDKKHSGVTQEGNSSKKPHFVSKTRSVSSVFKGNMFLRYAQAYPKDYLRHLGLFFVITEMIAVLTPSVAVGIQWMAALCPGTAKQAIIGFVEISIACLIHGNCEATEHCLLVPN